MSKSNTYENALLLLIFNNTNIANLGDATGVRGSAAAGNLYLALHTADPGEAGDQSTSEAAYTGYARKALARDNTTFTVAGNAVSLAADQTFPEGTGGAGTATHWSIGVASAGAGTMLYRGAINPTIVMGNGIAPKVKAGTLVTED